ncbi:MAG: AraC family transcriptional regulator [Alphaproteobacteria bacterium]
MVDVLSFLLSELRFLGTIYFHSQYGREWSVAVPEQGRTARLHVVLRGSCWISAEGSDGFERLDPGDVAIVPYGRRHFLRDHPERKPTLEVGIPDPDNLAVTGVGFGEGKPEGTVELLCGYFLFDQTITHPLSVALPPVLVARGSDEALRTRLGPLVELVCNRRLEARPGVAAVLNRLAELIFFETIGDWAERQKGALGLIAAMSDPHLGRALAAIHGDYGRDWSVGDLARVAGQSRTAFAHRFRDLMGMGPIEYLNAWRMTVGRRLVVESDQSLERIAALVGYGSSQAFARAFRRAHAASPGYLRRMRRENLGFGPDDPALGIPTEH